MTSCIPPWGAFLHVGRNQYRGRHNQLSYVTLVNIAKYHLVAMVMIVWVWAGRQLKVMSSVLLLKCLEFLLLCQVKGFLESCEQVFCQLVFVGPQQMFIFVQGCYPRAQAISGSKTNIGLFFFIFL